MQVVNPNQKAAQPPTPTPDPVQSGIEADLDVLITEGVIERIVTPFAGKDNVRVTMHTLTNAERVAVSKEIPNEELATLAATEHASKLPTLIYAITCIDMGDRKYTFVSPDEKIALRTFLSRMSAVMIDMLILKYAEMTNDLITVIETGVKKN